MIEIRDLLERMKEIFYRPNGGLSVIGMIVVAIILFLIARALSKGVARAVTKTIERRNSRGREDSRRVETLSQLVARIAKYGIYIIAALIFLDMIHVQTSTILATAGVGTLAIAMGAQVFIQDVINGFFIVFDDQYSVGDYVEFAGKSGYVQRLGIRATVIRDFDGAVHTVPNSEIKIVTNRGRGLKRAKVVVPVDRTEDPDRVFSIFKEALQKVETIYPDARTEIWGITGFVDDGYEITAAGWDDASLQFDLEYDMRKSLIEAMNEYEIAIPYPRYECVDDRGTKGADHE